MTFTFVISVLFVVSSNLYYVRQGKNKDHMALLTTTLPPGPKPFISGINLFSIRRNPIGFLTKIHQQYGDLAFFKLGPQPVFLLNNPDHIRDVLITHNKNFMKGEGLQRA